MSATDELRRLLDERGVEYGTGFGGDTLWTGRHGIRWRWDAQEGKLAMFTHDITPEQAVEATLGRGECRNLSKYVNWFECSCCGWTYDFVTDPYSGPRYCPNCGRRIADGQPG